MKSGTELLIDTHCHLDDPLLAPRLDGIVAAAGKSGVRGFIVPGVAPSNWQRIMALQARDGIFAAPGVHPLHADQWNQKLAAGLEKLAPEAVAIGEIGLDYSPGMPARDLQQRAFREQLQLARQEGLPVIVHCRRAFADTLGIIAEERSGELGGVMHAFSGSMETARQFISLGFRIGIAGPVTWSNAVKPVAIAREIGLEHLLLETDSPDLSPEPHRGMVNEPAFLAGIAGKLAEIKGIALAEVAAVTSANTTSLFRLPRWFDGTTEKINAPLEVD